MDQSQMSPEELITFVENLKRQWMNTIDALVDPLIIVNKNYEIVKANLAFSKYCNRPIKEVINKKCYELFAQQNTPCEGCQLEKTFADKSAQKFDLKSIRNEHDFEVVSQPMNNDPDFEGIVHIYRDRTEANALQSKLVQSEKLASIGLLAGGIAHEINNPIGGILIFSQMLLREIPESSSQHADVVEIEKAAQRCKSIVKQLLDFARLSPVQTKKELALVSVHSAMEQALIFASVHHRAKSLLLTKKLGDFEAWIKADKNSLIQVFLNLIQNAIHASSKNSEVIISSEKVDSSDGPLGIFSVKDFGTGMSAEVLKKIFDPFFSTKDPGQGTGLGLSICYSICEEFGGRIEATSKLNEGSSFKVIFPLTAPPEEKS